MKMIQKEQTQIEKERSDIEKTASTIDDLQRISNVPNSKQMLRGLEEEIGRVKSFCPDLSWLAASRHLTSRSLIERLSDNYNITEMGAGFSPHGINYSDEFETWTEIDLPHNSQLKEKIVNKISSNYNINFVAGNIYSKDVWQRAIDLIDVSKPSFIFCEGVVSQYGNEEQKDSLVEYIQPLIAHPESMLYIDDTFKNHPEFENDPRIKKIMGGLKKSLKRTSYANMKSRSLDSEKSKWESRGLTCEYVPYVITSEEFKDINEKLRGFLFKKR